MEKLTNLEHLRAASQAAKGLIGEVAGATAEALGELAEALEELAAQQQSGIPAAGGGIPSGLVAMWSGAADAVPSGWALCDGENGTPDLRGRFVLGSTNEVDAEGNTAHPMGETGGEEEHTLTEDEMPQHGHVETLTTNKHEYISAQKKYMSYVSIYPMVEHYEKSQGGTPYTRTVSRAPTELTYTESDASNENCYYVNLYDKVNSGSITPIQNTNGAYWRFAKTFDVGSSKAHNNMPPYYALCYIMKL